MAAPTQPILILGAGQYAADVADMMTDIPGLELAGYIEGRRHELCGRNSGDLPVHWIEAAGALSSKYKVVAAIGDPSREADIARLSEMGFDFATVQHPTAYVAASAIIGKGCVVAPGVVIGASTRVADHVIVNRGVLVGHHTKIAAYVTLGPGVNIGGEVALGPACFVGMGATIQNGVSLGAETKVAIASVVTRSFGDAISIAGIPARPAPLVGRT